jgi:hypothetical protein
LKSRICSLSKNNRKRKGLSCILAEVKKIEIFLSKVLLIAKKQNKSGFGQNKDRFPENYELLKSAKT